MDEKIFLVEEIKDINLEIGAANLFLQRAENQDELKVILAKGEMAHFHVTKQENQLEMSYKKNGKISREETDEIIVQIPENHHLENMSVSIGAGKLKAENITVMERLGLEVGAGKAKLKNMHVRNLAIECGVGKCHYEGVLEHDMKVQCGVGQVGEIISCEAVPKSKKLLCSQVKIGSQVRQIVSGIKAHYSPEEMVGKKVMVLVNLKPAKLAGVMSEGMILCAEDAEGNLALVTPEKNMPAGAEIC